MKTDKKQQKANRRKYFTGYKTLKNVHLFENFRPGNSGNFASDVAELQLDLNVLHALIDEGLLEPNGQIKGGIEINDINRYIEEEIGPSDMFGDNNDPDEYYAWMNDLMDRIREFGAKY